MRRDRGFTIVEMMVVLGVIGATAAITIEVGSGVRTEQRQADAAARDLGGASKALRLAAEDVRAGRYEVARWTLEKGVLRRGEEVVTRGVRAFEARTEGAAVRLKVTTAPRNSDPGTQGVVTVEQLVRVRAKEAP